MQKSKKITIFFIILLTLFFIFCQNILIKMGILYIYFLRPVLFVGLAFIFKILISNQIVIKKQRKDIVQYVLITVLSYMLLYIISGIVPGFGKNAYDTSIKGIILNIVTNVPVIISIEYIRYKLANNVFKKDKELIFILIVISFSIWDLNYRKILSGNFTPYTIFSFVFYNCIPVFIENMLFTYIAQNGDYLPNIVYRVTYNFFIWTLPILPKIPWVFEAILSTILPFFLLLYIRFLINSKNQIYAYETKQFENPKGLVPFSVILLCVIWFTLGAFPIKPIGVATASMYPKINVGDMVVVKSTKFDKLKSGDIIAYKLNDTTVIHRIKTINNINGKYSFITKGDNNEHEDGLPVSEDQVVGKIIFKIKYVAYPTIWLHSINSGRQNVGVETGKY